MDLTDEEINVRVAEVLGRHPGRYWCPDCKIIVPLLEVTSGGYHSPQGQTGCGCNLEYGVKPYASSLDACAEFEATLTDKIERNQYAEALIELLNREYDGEFRFIGATSYHVATAKPPLRCRAFLKVKVAL